MPMLLGPIEKHLVHSDMAVAGLGSDLFVTGFFDDLHQRQGLQLRFGVPARG